MSAPPTVKPPAGAAGWQRLLDPAAGALDDALAGWIAGRRWFRGKARGVTSARVVAALPLPESEAPAAAAASELVLAVVRVSYTDDGLGDEYVVPVALLAGDDPAAIAGAEERGLVIARVAGERAGEGGALVDALALPSALATLQAELGRSHEIDGEGGARLRIRRFGDDQPPVASLAARPLDAEQTNTSVRLGDAYILKVLRRLDEGRSADLEMGELLTEVGYAHAPPVAASVELLRGGAPATVAIMHRFVPNRGDAWRFALDQLAVTVGGERAPGGPVLPPELDALLGLLGRRVGELHLALASRPDSPEFAPRPLTARDRATLADAVRRALDAALRALADRRPALDAPAAAAVEGVLGRAPDVERRLARFVALADGDPGLVKMRVHGDLHLGQVLYTGSDFVLIDFEGEPARPLEERRARRSPLVDVAGMIRSLHYAAVTASREAAAGGRAGGAVDADALYRASRAAFEAGYGEAARAGRFLPADPAARAALLDFYLIEKCVYEVHYELGNRPDWVAIPIAGLADLLARDDAGGAAPARPADSLP